MDKNVALVLSSGGARGFAHIGAIEELEAQGYKITSVAGTSMGALIGGIYAAGGLEELKRQAFALNKKRLISLVDFSFSLNHFVKGDKVMEALTGILPDVKIEDLPIPFHAIATDLQNNQEVIFDKGSLFDAIRASISIPSFFRPVRANEKILIDGGIINPLPLNRVKRSEGDLLVAINVSSPGQYELELQKKIALSRYTKKRKDIFKKVFNTNKEVDRDYFSLLTQTFALMIQQNTALSVQITPPDILVNIPMNRFGGFDYEKAEKISQTGKNYTRKALADFNNSKITIQ